MLDASGFVTPRSGGPSIFVVPEVTAESAGAATDRTTERAGVASDSGASAGVSYVYGAFSPMTTARTTATRHAMPTLLPALPRRTVPTSSKARLWQESISTLDQVEVNPGVMGGELVIRGTWIPVYRVVGQASRGLTTQQIIDLFDGLIDEQDIKQAFAFAANLCR